MVVEWWWNAAHLEWGGLIMVWRESGNGGGMVLNLAEMVVEWEEIEVGWCWNGESFRRNGSGGMVGI